jgi:hypothetical protein
MGLLILNFAAGGPFGFQETNTLQRTTSYYAFLPPKKTALVNDVLSSMP